MNLPILIKKNNALTDGNIPNRFVLTNKLVNGLYKYYEDYGVEFTIKIPDLLRLLNLNATSGNNKAKLIEAIKILQQPIELRDFEYKGNGIAWLSAPFLSRAIIVKKNINEIKFVLDDMLIEALKQKKHYTLIDINTTNKFRTKYGITIYEMYLRYKNQTREGVKEDITYQMFSLEELNKKFGSHYKTKSEMLRCINRGLKEIEKITGKKIVVKWQKDHNKFGFFWRKDKPELKRKTDLHEFIKYIREKHVNTLLLEVKINDKEVALAVSEKGRLYDMYQEMKFNAKQSQRLWEHLFNHQFQIKCLNNNTI